MRTKLLLALLVGCVPPHLPITVCVPADDHIADIDDGIDCDDTRDDVYPGADEVWYDGVDQDCDVRNAAGKTVSHT